MTSKEIIIKLIDNKLISGEEAYILLNDILKAEMVAVNETLKEINKPPSINIPSVWTYPNTSAVPCTYQGNATTTTYASASTEQ